MRKTSKPLKKAPAPRRSKKVGIVEEPSYASQEYGVTEQELTAFLDRTHVEIQETVKKGKYRVLGAKTGS